MSKLVRQDGIVIGNVEDKENPTNPVARWLISGFDRSLLTLVATLAPASIHEVGCGEGRLARMLYRVYRVPLRASDFAFEVTESNLRRGDDGITYLQRSIYDLLPEEDHAELVICCEVLEHLEQPRQALRKLRDLAAPNYILSVPREPLWRAMNLARLRFISAWGNTPGHLNHWSQSGFARFLESEGFLAERWRSPLPWTMVLGKFE